MRIYDSGTKRFVGLALVAALTTACTSDSAKPPTTSASASLASSSSAPRSASAQLAFEGDAGLAGAATNATVSCPFPDVGGPSIAVLAQAPNSAFQFRIRVLADKVTIHVFSGSGADFHERTFDGPGVTNFDARKGAQIDARLSDAPGTPGTTAGAIGVVTTVKGTLDCAGQDPGSSTLTLTGDTAEGRLDRALLEQPRVECNNSGAEVVVVAILTVGSAKVFVDIGLRLDGIDLGETLQSGERHRYQAPPGSATLDFSSARASGEAVEQDAAPPHVLHVEGAVVCGTAVN